MCDVVCVWWVGVCALTYVVYKYIVQMCVVGVVRVDVSGMCDVGGMCGYVWHVLGCV